MVSWMAAHFGSHQTQKKKAECHLYDWIWAVFFGKTIFPEIVLFFNFKVIVGTVVVKDILFSFNDRLRVFIKFSLKKIIFPGDYFKCAIHLMQAAFRLLNESLGIFKRRDS